MLFRSERFTVNGAMRTGVRLNEYGWRHETDIQLLVLTGVISLTQLKTKDSWSRPQCFGMKA